MENNKQSKKSSSTVNLPHAFSQDETELLYFLHKLYKGDFDKIKIRFPDRSKRELLTYYNILTNPIIRKSTPNREHKPNEFMFQKQFNLRYPDPNTGKVKKTFYQRKSRGVNAQIDTANELSLETKSQMKVDLAPIFQQLYDDYKNKTEQKRQKRLLKQSNKVENII